MEKLPFMATENIMMEAVKRGGNRQELHEAIRVHSQAAAYEVKMNGKPNDLIDRLVADPLFNLKKEDIEKELDPAKYTGRASSQVVEFITEFVDPLLKKYQGEEITATLKV